MSKSEHVRALLAGEEGIPPAVSCWYHFPPEQHAPREAADAHLRHFEAFDLDFIKVMCEVGYPRDGLGRGGVIRSVADLRTLKERPGHAGVLEQQLELIRLLSESLGGEVPLTTTIFHSWMTLRNLLVPHKDQHHPPVIEGAADTRDALLTQMLREDAPAVVEALDVIGRTLANFTRACIDAGADGIYLATRDDWVDTPDNEAALRAAQAAAADEQEESESAERGRRDEASGEVEIPPYDALVAQSDDTILYAAEDGWFNFVHLCGNPRRIDRHWGNPLVHVLHWADRVTGPSIADVRGALHATYDRSRLRPPAMAAGVNNLQTLPGGTPHQVAAEVVDALAAAEGHPLIVAPGCTYDPQRVPEANLRALVEAVRACGFSG